MPASAAKKNSTQPKHPEGVEFFYDIEQGSEEWHELHRGIPTAGAFASIMASPKEEGAGMRQTYLERKAGEILCSLPIESWGGYSNSDMERGLKMEPEAKAWVQRTRLTEVVDIGFVRRKLPTGRYVGCSPDGFVGDWRHSLEVKTMRPDHMVAHIDKPMAFTRRHRAQCQGILWVTGGQELTLIGYFSGMDLKHEFKIERDEHYIRQLDEAVQTFDWDLHLLVERARNRSRNGKGNQ